MLLGPPRAFRQFKSDGSEVWATSEVGGALRSSIRRPSAIKQTVTFDIPGLRAEAIQPVGINLTKDGKLGFIDLGPANRVAVVDGVTHAVLKISACRPTGLALAPLRRTRNIWWSPTASQTTFPSSTSRALKVIKSIQVGELPWGVAFGPN